MEKYYQIEDKKAQADNVFKEAKASTNSIERFELFEEARNKYFELLKLKISDALTRVKINMNIAMTYKYLFLEEIKHAELVENFNCLTMLSSSSIKEAKYNKNYFYCVFKHYRDAMSIASIDYNYKTKIEKIIEDFLSQIKILYLSKFENKKFIKMVFSVSPIISIFSEKSQQSYFKFQIKILNLKFEKLISNQDFISVLDLNHFVINPILKKTFKKLKNLLGEIYEIKTYNNIEKSIDLIECFLKAEEKMNIYFDAENEDLLLDALDLFAKVCNSENDLTNYLILKAHFFKGKIEYKNLENLEEASKTFKAMQPFANMVLESIPQLKKEKWFKMSQNYKNEVEEKLKNKSELTKTEKEDLQKRAENFEIQAKNARNLPELIKMLENTLDKFKIVRSKKIEKMFNSPNLQQFLKNGYQAFKLKNSLKTDYEKNVYTHLETMMNDCYNHLFKSE